MEGMRTTSVLGIIVCLASLAAACGDASTSGGLLNRRGVPNPGEQVDHDDSTDGADSSDPGNPNANTPPPAPGSGGQAGAFSVTLSTNTPSADMEGSVPIDVTLTPTDFAGAANITVTGLPANVTADPLSINLGASPGTGRLVIKVAAGAVASAPNTGYPIQIVATSGARSANATASFKVNPKITLRIPVNLDALRAAGAGTVYKNEWGTAFGTAPVPLRTQAGNGIVVNVYNADSAPHSIHGANGFAHGDTANPIAANSFEMQNGAPRIRTLNVGASSNGYPHEGANGPSASFRISVQASP